LQKGGVGEKRIGMARGETALITIQELKTAKTRSLSVGSYEVVNSRVQSGGREMLVEAAARLLKELKR